MSSVYIIAEAGVNHNGSLKLAKELVDAAKDAGADAVKFQTFISKNIVSKSAEKAKYQVENTASDESQYKMLKNLELTFEDFTELKEYCDIKKIEFMSTAFDLESISFLASMGLKRWKIPSGEITNLPYLEKVGSLKKPVILSTGMSTLDEIKQSVDILRKKGVSELTVLHCTTEYPAPYEDVNLRAMLTIKNEFDVHIGYSDHTKGIEVPLAAVALGAKVIEKHFTLSKCMDGPDHRASLEPDELKAMINGIRKIEKVLGSYEKKPSIVELNNRKSIRKSIVSNRRIKKGEAFTIENLTTKRPGTGISPMKWHDLLGKTAKRDFKEDELIEI